MRQREIDAQRRVRVARFAVQSLLLGVALIGIYHYLFICLGTPVPPPVLSQEKQPATRSPTTAITRDPSATEFERKSQVLSKRLDRAVRFTRSRAVEELIQKYHSTDPVRFRIETTFGVMEARTAPLDVVPVAVRYFLEQVESGFWENRSKFFRAESHVIQATPDYGSDKKFKSHGIELQDYSADYPHKRYRLGLAGRPGGPDFYVNMQENEQIHGPGGQGHNYNGDDEADPCFAELVGEDSERVADRIQAAPHERREGLKILKEPVRILSIKLVR